MEGVLGQGALGPGAGKQAGAQAAQAVLNTYAAMLRLDDPDDELVPLKTTVDDLGYVHARFEQAYEGVPVWGRDLYVHFDARGDVYAINGSYEPTPRAVSTTPTLAAEAALGTVVADLKADQRWAPLPDDVVAWLGLEGPTTRLVLYPDAAQGLRLAYEVSIHPNLLEWYTYLVDAENGDVLNRFSRHCSIHYDPTFRPTLEADGLRRVAAQGVPLGSKAAGGTGTFFNATATDLNGQTQNFRVYQHDVDNRFYKLWDLDNLNLAQSVLPDQPTGGALTISANNTDLGENADLTHVNSNNNTWADPVSVSAHANMNVAYEYYTNTHGRNAIDDLDQSIISVIHVTDQGQPVDNAFWTGRLMVYGDGAQFFRPLAGGLDVAAHEMTHGVIQHSADLIYQFQSGALNESFADVFGAMVDRDDFFMGEDIMLQHDALRDLLNPNNPRVLSGQPAHMSQFQNLNADQDNGGVHINSGIPNRAAALIIQAIGHADTEEIYYRALTQYLTRNSQFGDARNAVERAASDLFGGGSQQLAAVQQAFDAVGITTTGETGGDGGNDVPPQTNGTSQIAIQFEDGTIGVVDPATGGFDSFDFGDPRGMARVTPDRAQLSTPRSGDSIWFINQLNQLAYIDVETGEGWLFPNLVINQTGDLRNASISPDGNFVALTSTDIEDATLYIYDVQADELLGGIPLLPETSQVGVVDESIQFPDVVSWSPNPTVLRIAFDALSEIPLGTGQYWGMYEIDFNTERIYSLIPSQPTDISVGNVTYSNTDPDLIAFNVVTDLGGSSETWDILVADFSAGQIFSLDIPSTDIGGNQFVTDAERPTFSPDDNQIAFSSPDFNALLFFDGNTGNLSGYDFGEPVYNPRWFIFTGSTGSQNQAPTASFTATPSSGMAPVQVTLNASASSDPDGDPITYRWDFGDGSIGSGVTATHTYAFAGPAANGFAFTVTLTVLDGGGLSSTATRQVTIQPATNTDVETDAELPRTVALHPNHPNPFNPATVLRFDLPASEDVELTVYDMLGRTVTTLIRERVSAGTHEVRFEAGDLPSGVYMARLRAGSVVQTRTMVLLR